MAAPFPRDPATGRLQGRPTHEAPKMVRKSIRMPESAWARLGPRPATKVREIVEAWLGPRCTPAEESEAAG